MLRMALQHRGQGLLLVREKGVNLCLYLGRKGGRYASSPSLTIVLCRWGTGGQGEWSGWVTQGAKDSAPPLSAGGLVPVFCEVLPYAHTRAVPLLCWELKEPPRDA